MDGEIMKIPFYILGLLIRYGPQHGYSLKHIIEERISDFAKIKLPSIYYHLDRLKEMGYVSESIDRDGNRPEKTVYSITEIGRKHFEVLYKMQMDEGYPSGLPLDGVLYFSETSDRSELLNTLEFQRQDMIVKMEELILHREQTMKDTENDSEVVLKAIFEHHRCHIEAEINWLKNTIEGLSR